MVSAKMSSVTLANVSKQESRDGLDFPKTLPLRASAVLIIDEARNCDDRARAVVFVETRDRPRKAVADLLVAN